MAADVREAQFERASFGHLLDARAAAMAAPPCKAMLVSSDNVALYLREPHVLHGYRPESRSIRASLGSLFYVHNQSAEVILHAVALVVYAVLALLTFDLLREDERATLADYVVFAVYYIGVLVCFGTSTSYHLLGNHSEAVHDFTYRLDRAGIVAPFFGSMLLLSSYAFVCYPVWRAVHMTATTATCSAVLVTIARDVDASAVRGRFVRVAVSVAMFSVGLLCMLHIVLVSGDQGTLMGRRFMMTYGMYGVGLIFYVFRIPEAWSPGTFDFMFKSHQLWHAMVFVGATNFYFLVTETYLWSKEVKCNGPA